MRLLFLQSIAWGLFLIVGSLIAAPDRSPFDEPPENFQPLVQQTESDQDHAAAMAKVTFARFLEQREQHAEAVRQYQRAHRLTPETSGLLKDIFRLCTKLERPAEATRYMLLLCDLPENQLNAMQCLSLATLARRNNEFERTAKLLQQAIALLEKEQITEKLGVHLQLMEINLKLEKPTTAAEHAAIVHQLLENYEKNGLKKTYEKFSEENLQKTYLQIARVFLSAEQYEQATLVFQQANQFMPAEIQLRINVAEVALKQKQPAVGLTELDICFNKMEKLDGVRPYELYRELLALEESDSQKTAEELITRLRPLYDANSEKFELAYFLADQYLILEKWQTAADLVNDHLKQHKSKLANQILVEAYFQQGQSNKLLGALDQAVSTQFDLSFVEEQVEKIIADEKRFAKLIETAESRLKAGQGISSITAVALARMWEGKANYQESWKWIKRAASADQDKLAGSFLLAWALDVFQKDQFQLAEQAVQKAIELKPPKQQRALLFFYLATLQQFQEKDELALESANQAIALQGDSPLYLSRLPWVYFQQGQYDQAKRYYKRVLAQFDKIRTSDQIREIMKESRSILSNIALQQDNQSEAEEWLEEILDEFPEEIGTLNDLGYLWVDQNKNVQRGLRMISKAVNADPENMAYRDSLGWAYFRTSQLDKAEEQISLAIKLAKEPDPVVFDHLAEVQHQLGKTAAAITSWEQAIKLFEEAGNAEESKRITDRLREIEQKTN